MDDKHPHEKESEEQKTLLFKDGKLYFTRETERKFFFAMTIIMMILFIVSEMGWF